jgi:hypothetical protein
MTAQLLALFLALYLALFYAGLVRFILRGRRPRHTHKRSLT